MKYFLAICSGIALCLFISSGATSAAPNPRPSQPAWAANNGQDRGHYKKERARVAFSVHDREAIRSYFREYPSDLPPGLAKRGGDLPPGLEKHLREDGTLPPGLEKRLRPCPVGLERRLPPLPHGYSRRMLGTRLLILDSANVIRDVMILSR